MLILLSRLYLPGQFQSEEIFFILLAKFDFFPLKKILIFFFDQLLGQMESQMMNFTCMTLKNVYFSRVSKSDVFLP